jgi:hypothetical protein
MLYDSAVSLYAEHEGWTGATATSPASPAIELGGAVAEERKRRFSMYLLALFSTPPPPLEGVLAVCSPSCEEATTDARRPPLLLLRLSSAELFASSAASAGRNICWTKDVAAGLGGRGFWFFFGDPLSDLEKI